jgi:glycosyltransferase involved in cell wall biosynthesis
MARISILLPDLRGGGAERVSIDLARAFRILGHEVDFVLLEAKGEFLAETKRDFFIADLGVKKFRSTLKPLARYLRNRQPEAMIANMWPLTSASVIGRIFSHTKTRLLLVEHTTLSASYASWGYTNNLMMRASIRATYWLADKIAAVSIGAANDTATLAGLAKHRVAVLYNPIPKRPKPSSEAVAMAEQLWSCPNQQRILSVGNLKDAKNYPLLLRAFASLSRRDVRLMILGSGDDTALRGLAYDIGIAERVIFPGFYLDPSPFYETADLFVLSSDHEGFGNVIVEALSFGLPIVSTDCPSGPAEILEYGRWGRLVPVGDTRALANAMNEVLSATTDREALKRRAADFAPEIAARKYLKLLEMS